jgi:hypothetical protein
MLMKGMNDDAQSLRRYAEDGSEEALGVCRGFRCWPAHASLDRTAARYCLCRFPGPPRCGGGESLKPFDPAENLICSQQVLGSRMLESPDGHVAKGDRIIVPCKTKVACGPGFAGMRTVPHVLRHLAEIAIQDGGAIKFHPYC